MKTDHTLTAARLREVLDYDPETGVFRWKVAISWRVRIGAVAGCERKTDRYRVISVDGTHYRAHRLAHVYVTGWWPDGEVDHRNQDKTDNRWANLRVVPHAGNGQNISRPNANNSHGHRGATRNGHRWQSKISVGGKTVTLGNYATAEEASVAYFAAKTELHPFWAAVREEDNQ